ncbi:MAG: hypothetical protein HGB26_06380 [Desulfobulbaceae bacterium]|nr:hypothetical protein [Desulfobulbaceae bacterium]
MKKICNFCLVVVITVLFLSGLSAAATFNEKVHVRADDTGLVTITGSREIVKLVQFCPDKWARSCDDNITIKREGDSFLLNKVGLANHQTVFNFRDSSGKWLRIPSEEVTCGANVICETEKGYFTYTGAAAKK